MATQGLSAEQKALCERLEGAHNFPCEYTFKLVAGSGLLADDEVRAIVGSIDNATCHAISRKSSSKGRWESVTVVVRAEKSVAIVLLYELFGNHEDIKYLL